MAWRTLRFCVGGLLGVGPSGLPAHSGSGLPPAQVTVMPLLNRMIPPPGSMVDEAGDLVVLGRGDGRRGAQVRPS